MNVQPHRHWIAVYIVAVGVDLCEEPVQTFQAFTSHLQRMADWLVATAISTVAMESTGVYWVRGYEVLESRGIEVIVANAPRGESCS